MFVYAYAETLDDARVDACLERLGYALTQR